MHGDNVASFTYKAAIATQLICFPAGAGERHRLDMPFPESNMVVKNAIADAFLK